MNKKNELQEFFQKNKTPLPKYDTVRCGGEDHTPLFISTVILYNNDRYDGEKCNNKIKAENSAADIALSNIIKPKDFLNKCSDLSVVPITQCSPKIIKTIDKSLDNTVILVDVENLHKFTDDISEKILLDNKFTIYAFVGEHHHLINKKFHHNINKIVVPSTRPDACDTCIQVYTGMLLTRESYDNYLIATRDHFGSSLVEMIQSSNMGWKAKNARLITDPAKIII